MTNKGRAGKGRGGDAGELMGHAVPVAGGAQARTLLPAETLQPGGLTTSCNMLGGALWEGLPDPAWTILIAGPGMPSMQLARDCRQLHVTRRDPPCPAKPENPLVLLFRSCLPSVSLVQR